MGRKRSPEDNINAETPSTKRQKGNKKAKTPLYKAVVTETAQSEYMRSGAALANVDSEIVAKIKKCLERATHGSNSGETNETILNEAKAAMRIAERLMKANNIKQADIMAHESPESQKLFAGKSVVSIQRVDGDRWKPVRYNVFVGPLGVAMQHYFGCKAYTESGGSDIVVVFYGIAEQTVAAAVAFRMVYNLIVEWALPLGKVYRRNEYCLGVAHALGEEGKRLKREEEEEAKRTDAAALRARVEREEAERRAELDRLEDPVVKNEPVLAIQLEKESDDHFVKLEKSEDDHTVKIEDVSDHGSISETPRWRSAIADIPSPAASSSNAASGDNTMDCDGYDSPSDDDISEANDAEFTADFDRDEVISIADDIDEQIKVEAARLASPVAAQAEAEATKSAIATDGQDEASEQKWASHMQLTTFRQSEIAIADQYLEDQGVKLGKERKVAYGKSDWEAYNKGRDDSKKIDVRGNMVSGD